jgi:hypothetical protein
MLLARIVCSDPGCYEEKEVVVEFVDQLNGLVCECGHGFVLESVSSLAARPAQVFSMDLHRPAHRSDRRRAA